MRQDSQPSQLPGRPDGQLVSAEALRAILSSLGTAPSFRDCMRECALTLHQWTQADGAGVFRLTSDGRELQQIHSVGFPLGMTEGSRRLPVDQSFAGTAVRHRELIISDCIALDERIPRGFRDDLIAAKFHTIIALPLLMHADVVGAIVLGWCHNLRLSELDRELLLTIGYGVAIAVEHDLRAFESTRDGLTGLFNRRAFDTEVEELIQACRETGKPLSFVLLDLDDFKRCNDQYGHQTGDRVLKALGQTLTQQLLTEAGSAYRLGGEEFALLLPSATPEHALALAEAICRQVAALRFPSGDNGEFGITISGGVANFRAHADETVETLYDRADQAMYAAKQAGKNQICCNPEGAG